MSHPTISVEKLSKAYRIGLKDAMHDTLVGAMKSALGAPFRNLRRLNRLNTFSSCDEAEDTFWALRDISFEVQEGTVLGVIGRNGAGKSTLLKILSRITEPTSGRAVIRGRVSSLLEVGTGFHPELSGRENIYMNGTILGMTKREINGKLDQIVDFSGVEKFIDTPVKRYSSGMKVRLAFAVAAHLEPEVLIIDEVLAVGDAEFQKKCLGKMQDVAKSGRTVLFVSHNMSAVDDLCHEVIWLCDGGINLKGATNDVVRQYLHDTASSVGSTYRGDSCSDDPVSLVGASIVTCDGNNSGVLRFAEPFQIRTSWRHRTFNRHASYSIRVMNARGTLVFATNTINDDSIDISAPGEYELECAIEPNLLSPGDYTITVGAWIRGRTCLCNVPDCLQFTVASIPYDRENPFLAAGNPVIAAPASWSILEAVNN